MLIVVLLKQILIMAILMAVGVFLSRKGFLCAQGSRDIGAILLRIVIPCVIVRSYLTEYTPEKMEGFLYSLLFALIAYVLAMAISYVVYGKRRRIDNFSAAFCNAGFIGIPLVQAVIGQEGVFYLAASIAFLNMFQWTYGVYIMTDRKEAISLKAIVTNPVVIATLIGAVLFVVQLPVPELVRKSLGYLADMNTPLAMLLLGSYLAKLKASQIFADRRAYGSVLMRLVVIPLAVIVAFRLVPCANPDVASAAALAAITPVGANICVFAQQYDCDYTYSVVTVCLSTILSLVTIPAMFALMQLILK